MNISDFQGLQYHCRNVGLCAYQLSNKLGLDYDTCLNAYITGLIHDLGKSVVNQAILNKPTKLSDQEFEMIKLHVEHSVSIAIENYHSQEIVQAVAEHHENFDGTGYPNQLKELQISLLGRILRLSDFFISLFENRVYRKAFSCNDALKIIYENAKLFDPKVLNTFSSLFEDQDWLEFLRRLSGENVDVDVLEFTERASV